jgi:hypothetical protein
MTFETFFVSREEISNPLLPGLIDAGKTLADHGCPDGVISARYGNRVVLSTASLDNLSIGDFVELADYDPSRHIAMVIGTAAPPQSVPLHWLLYRRSEVNAAVQLHHQFEDAPAADIDPDGAIDEVMEVLRLLKNNMFINLGDDDCIAVCGSIAAVLDVIPCV